jgi:hypothetical protein
VYGWGPYSYGNGQSPVTNSWKQFVIKGSWWQCSAYNDTTDNDKMQISERFTYVIQDKRLDSIVTFFPETACGLPQTTV